jgi:hypothetical protein
MSGGRRKQPLAVVHGLLLRGLIAMSVAVVERQLRKALAKRAG